MYLGRGKSWKSKQQLSLETYHSTNIYCGLTVCHSVLGARVVNSEDTKPLRILYSREITDNNETPRFNTHYVKR